MTRWGPASWVAWVASLLLVCHALTISARRQLPSDSVKAGAKQLSSEGTALAKQGYSAVKSGAAAQAAVDLFKKGPQTKSEQFLTSDAALVGIASLPNTQCVICQYVLGRLGQEIGFPEQINDANTYPRFEPNAALAASAAPTGYSPASYGTKPGYDAPLPGPGFSYLELSSTHGGQQQRPHRQALAAGAAAGSGAVSDDGAAGAVAEGEKASGGGGGLLSSFVETGARFINGIMEGLGIEVCRPGMHACRPRLRQPGRHSLERRIKMIQIATDQTNMEELMTYSLNLICNNELPDVFKPTCLKVGHKVAVVAQEYLHDYTDSEICADVGICVPEFLGIPRKPHTFPF